MKRGLSTLFRRQRADEECVEVRMLSSDYLDGELDNDSSVKVEGHLEKCHLCRAFLNTLKATIRLLTSTRGPEPPATFRERLAARLRKEGAR